MMHMQGALGSLADEPVFSFEDVSVALDGMMSEQQRGYFSESADLDFAFQSTKLGRFRVKAFQHHRGPGVVLRVLAHAPPSIEQLAVADPMAKSVLINWADQLSGLVLFSGRAGSGKSSTQAAVVERINTEGQRHVIMVEDPIEFVHDNQMSLVNQREIGVHSRGFKQALRAALREDPDIILVGELRDLETIEIAIETAQTGHLVFGTLHTNTAVSTVDRLIDQFPVDRQNQIRVMLSESLRGVISQVLLKKKGGGRVAALEIMVHSRALANLIREGKSFQIPSLMQTRKNQGNQLQLEAFVTLIRDGKVDPKEALSKAANPENAFNELVRQGLIEDQDLDLG